MPATSVLLSLAQSELASDRAIARDRILTALRASNGNITHAAPLVAPPVSRVTLHRAILVLDLTTEIERLFSEQRSDAMVDRALGMTATRTAEAERVARAVKKKPKAMKK